MLVYYLTLDLPLDATDQQIREAYLQKVKKYTPEKDPEKFRKINDAYEVVRIINEPTAASLAYESEQSHTQKILVYDLGGGTFDVSIVKIEQGIIEVLASTGDNHLGGDDFDRKIVELLLDHIENELKLSVRKNLQVMARAKLAYLEKRYHDMLFHARRALSLRYTPEGLKLLACALVLNGNYEEALVKWLKKIDEP